MPLTKTTPLTNQSVDLPEGDLSSLLSIEVPLKEIGKFEEWVKAVETVLQQHKLHRLIHVTIPCPQPNSIHAERCRRLSILVRAWLGTCIPLNLFGPILHRVFEIEHADHFMAEFKKHILGKGHRASNAI